ncbi:hypothetical protein [Amycolatopsis speibonae]|uniref:Type II toxin-antitoxin system HicB family antitoxin n=1 Tax=Amycolatopsis speibonae TaxID=1450224 RepID=A0ABV7P873_9PSEU
MKTYRGAAVRDGRFWLVRVEGVGATQGRSKPEARYMAAELIETLHGISRAEFDVHIDFAP